MRTMLYFIVMKDDAIINYEKYLHLVTPEKKVLIQRFKFDFDKKLCLFSDLFIRYLACTELQLSNTELIFVKNAFGKPNLLGVPHFHYNISHTKNAIVIGLSGEPIGVDVEKIKESNLMIAERCFCENELAYIFSKKDQDKAFYEVWTRKEAYIKWTGKGLSLPLNTFDVTGIELKKMIRSCGNRTAFCASSIRLFHQNRIGKTLGNTTKNSIICATKSKDFSA